MPTIKQKAAVLEITENHISVSKAMERVGYKENTYKKPSNLTDSYGFKELMIDMGIDDRKLLTVLNDGLNATSKGEVDFNTRHKYLETGLKLKGLVIENNKGNITQINIGNDENSEQLRKKFTEFMEGETVD